MPLRYLEWFLRWPVPDPPAILYEVLPYKPAAADRILQHLCALAGFDPAAPHHDRKQKDRVRGAFALIIEAAGRWEARGRHEKIEAGIAAPAWRTELRKLRAGRSQLKIVIRDRSACRALQLALHEIGLAGRAKRRWLHYLRDHPAALRKTLDHALKSKVLQEDAGRPSRFDRVLLIRGVGQAYTLITGKSFGRSVTSETRSRRAGQPAGPGLDLAWTCLEPLDPEVTREGIAGAIRSVQQRATAPKALMPLED